MTKDFFPLFLFYHLTFAGLSMVEQTQESDKIPFLLQTKPWNPLILQLKTEIVKITGTVCGVF